MSPEKPLEEKYPHYCPSLRRWALYHYAGCGAVAGGTDYSQILSDENHEYVMANDMRWDAWIKRMNSQPLPPVPSGWVRSSKL